MSQDKQADKLPKQRKKYIKENDCDWGGEISGNACRKLCRGKPERYKCQQVYQIDMEKVIACNSNIVIYYSHQLTSVSFLEQQNASL